MQSSKPWEIVTDVLKLMAVEAKAGVTTKELDALAEQRIIALGGTPYNKGYQPKWSQTPFPATMCISINDELVHGIPSDRKLEDGDVVTFDVGVKKDGLCGDAALTVGIGKIRTRDKKLLNASKRALYAGIEKVKAGAKVSEISLCIDTCAQIYGFKTCISFSGHGIGKEMHEAPYVPNVRIPSKFLPDEELKVGQMICIEPTLTKLDRIGVRMIDGWTFKTRDGSNAAMFEHQLRVTQDGCEILTDHIQNGSNL